MTLVSVLIPVYNGDTFLAAALESALRQTHHDLEILVGDDCSTDTSRELAEAYAARDPRIRVLPALERNLGAPRNQIRLHQAARGGFIKPLLQDDLLAPRCVQTLLAGLRADETAALATSKRGLIDASGQRLPDQPWTAALTDGDVHADGIELGDAMLRSNANLVGEVTTVLYRAGLVPPEELWTLDGHEYRGNGDIVLWLKLLAGRHAFYTPNELSFFRQHPGQASHRPDIIIGGSIEWARMTVAARGFGYLSDPAAELAAHTQAAATAERAFQLAAGHPEFLPQLSDALGPLLARVELLSSAPPVIAETLAG
ncbi:MAG: hypothetical protein JWM31_1088 [Solirubrobacterales bacterium]|nr:hypothetical protein [Solirubrobacterales bacterium]